MPVGPRFWARLTPAKGMTAAPVRSTPITLSRAGTGACGNRSPSSRATTCSSPSRAGAGGASPRSRRLFLRRHRGRHGLLRAQAEAALAEVVAAGLVNADSYSGLRALLIPSERRRRLAARRRRIALFGLEDAGGGASCAAECRPGHGVGRAGRDDVAAPLRRRVRRVLAREAEWLPPWHALLRVYRRLEGRERSAAGASWRA